MATGAKTSVTETVTKSVPAVALTLTLDEAQALYDVTRNVGGHDLLTRRKLIDNIHYALENAGVKINRAAEDDIKGTLIFKEPARTSLRYEGDPFPRSVAQLYPAVGPGLLSMVPTTYRFA